MKKYLFIDRDGTLVIEPPVDKQLDSLEKLEFLPGVFHWLGKIVREMDYELVMVTNQDGLGTASFPEETFWPAQQKMIQAFANEGIVFSEVLIDKSFAEENLPTRKPGIVLLTHYMKGLADMQHSFVIGDRATDVKLAENLGCKSILLHNDKICECSYHAKSWKEIYQFLSVNARTASIERQTSETNINVAINLDGTGKAVIDTGIGFFDHMLQQVARHSNIDLKIIVKGDLEIDEHHSIEDVAISLGTAVDKALGSKKSIERYGFLLPMDDCLAQVAIDFSGRPWLVWDVAFAREKVGEMPTEMFMHFFKSFSDSARCNLNIKAEGTNEHHKIEAIFKAFSKAMKMAISKTKDDTIPSTKGVL
ncbi:MAG: bifunctional histidinol-phosphatase/imidazoleglycerol-phosphate dehydratase HisB [Ferruginibacter sp.]